MLFRARSAAAIDKLQRENHSMKTFCVGVVDDDEGIPSLLCDYLARFCGRRVASSAATN